MIRWIACICFIVVLLSIMPGRGASADKDTPFENSLGMRFVPVAISDDKPVMFSIWKTRVKDFDAFVSDAHYDATKNMLSLGAKGNGDRDVANWKSPGFPQTELHPVCGVSHIDAVAFCVWLSKKEGRHYRLPTDHEWELARSGLAKRKNKPTGRGEMIEKFKPSIPGAPSGRLPKVRETLPAKNATACLTFQRPTTSFRDTKMGLRLRRRSARMPPIDKAFTTSAAICGNGATT